MPLSGEDCALGALLGAACGDAAGAGLERSRGTVSLAKAQAAVRMPDSSYRGRWQPGGRTTDDTQLTICLARGLAGHPPTSGFPAGTVAEQYVRWFANGAYCGGRTCKAAFGTPRSAGGADLAARMRARADANLREHPERGEANGALMRATPLGVWGHRLPPEAVAAAARADAALSHPAQACRDASALYSIALAHLVAAPGDAQGALAAAEAWADAHAERRVRYWLRTESRQPLESVACANPASKGCVRWGFVLAFHHLRRRTPFEQAIVQTLCRGGDTDTNAAIVGGLMGALHGTSVIPAFMLQPVESYSGGRCPADLRPSCLRGLAQQLYREARAAGGRAQPAGGRLPGAAAKSKRSAPGAAAAGGQQAGGSSRAQAALSPARAAGLAALQRVQPAGGVSLEEPDAAPQQEQQEQQEQQQPAARKRPQRQPPMGASGGGGGITDVVDLTGEDEAEEEGGPPALPPAKKRHTATDDY